jgi:hypothetical protein
LGRLFGLRKKNNRKQTTIISTKKKMSSSTRYICVLNIRDKVVHYVDLNLLKEQEEFYLQELDKDVEQTIKNRISNIPLRTEMTELYGVKPMDNVEVICSYVIQ